ncbi:uncharacterized protein LOC111245509 [Varroa destructor]|uniref:Uncharacterized protein n=2 Tax=Varroa TaxID=62624 RepID=A0A7M7JBS7_VARDE|nr:uncharacterized protein LOC111245509 [Varroa destructor]
MTNVPDFNFCIYSTDVVRLVTDCTLSFLPKDYTEEFRTTLSELFGGLSLSECLRIICQNNNYDGFMLLQNWIEELDKNLQPTARFVGWNCVEKYEHLYARDIA